MTKTLIYVLLAIVFIAVVNTFIGGLAGQAIICLVFSILIFIGKGDFLIAGYNNASQE